MNDDAQQIAERSARVLSERDRASDTLGIRLIRVGPGKAVLTMTVRPDMLNGHALCHGGLIFTLADTAFAFACNSYGDATVAATGSIDFLMPGREGDVLTASAQEIWRAGRSGIYEIVVTNQAKDRVALFRGRSARIAGRLID